MSRQLCCWNLIKSTESSVSSVESVENKRPPLIFSPFNHQPDSTETRRIRDFGRFVFFGWILFHLFNLVDIKKSVIIPSNLCYQWPIEFSVESVDIMRSYTLSQGYDKYIKCALCALYHALSLAISLYLAMRHFCAVSLHQRNAPSPLVAWGPVLGRPPSSAHR